MSSIKENAEGLVEAVAGQADKLPLTATAQESYEIITSNIITLMGLSFILGVFFTTFLLLILEFVRRNRGAE